MNDTTMILFGVLILEIVIGLLGGKRK